MLKTDQGLDRWSQRFVVAFVLLSCIRAWTGAWTPPEARGQIPDAGTQRREQIDESRRTNQLLLEIRTILTDQVLNVRIHSADNPKDAPRGGTGGRP